MLPKFPNWISLLFWLFSAWIPCALAEGQPPPAQLSWQDIFEMQRQYTSSALTQGTATAEPVLVSRLVKPSGAHASPQGIRIKQIPNAEIFVPYDTDSPPFAAAELDIPSTAQIKAAAQELWDRADERLRPASSTIEVAQRETLVQPRQPGRSLPVVGDGPASITTQVSSTPEIQVAEIERFTASVIEGKSRSVAPRPLPVSVSPDSDNKLQNIGSYSPTSNSAALINAQLQHAEDGLVDDALTEDANTEDKATTSYALEFSKQLLGLFVDGEEQPALIAAHDGTEYLLPLVTILASSGASLDPDAAANESSELRVNTPGGPATLQEEDLTLVDGQLMITQSVLAEKLLIETSFDQSSFALYLVLPWSLKQQNQFLAFTAPEPDFEPPAASIRNMRADLFYVSNATGSGMNGDYFFSGNLGGGGWRFRAEQYGDNETTPSEYYWAKDWGKSMMLAGNSNFSLHPLLPTVEQTGVQYLYSNTPLPTSSGADITSTNGTKRIANGIRDIAGMATPGAVAELRIDGRVETRTRVRLDGSYDFPDVELPTRGYSEIIVHLLDNSTGALIETQDFSRRSGIELLANGQQTLFAAVGQQGNTLDSGRDSLGTSTAAQWRYGLTEDLTVELGRQQVGDVIGNEAAVSMAFSKHWFGSLAFADSVTRSSLGIDIEGGASNWNFDLSMRDFNLKESIAPLATSDQDFTLGLLELVTPETTEPTKQWARSANFRYQINEHLNVGLVGRDTNTSYEKSNFLLPTASWSNRRNLSISARPNSDGEYRVDSRYSPNQNSSVRYAYEDHSHLLDYRLRGRTGKEYYASYSTDDEGLGRLETGMVSHFENERFGTLQMGLINGENGLGYSIEWEATFVPGISSQLRLSKGSRALTLSDTESDLFLQWHVTFDFAVAQKRIVPADSSSAATQSAALTGNLMLGDEKIPSRYDIERIELLIDGDTYTARVQGGRYYIEGLQPGLHKVGIDARYLPMELSPLENQSFWVRLEKSAATEVPLGLEVKYSIAGRVRDANGVNQPYQRLLILAEDSEVVGEVYTDQFGLYRTNNLPPGKYRVVADRNGKGDTQIEVVVSDSYLFEQNLVIAAVVDSTTGDS